MAAATVAILCLVEGASGFLVAWRAWQAPNEVMTEERSYMEYDELLGWRSRPNQSITDLYGPGKSFRTNSQGFRGAVDYAPTVPLGRTRIICSGDSFTLGHSVADDEAWCARLAQADPRLETVNMGQGGYGFDQAFLWYRRDAAGLAHQVQLFAFISTDFERMEFDNFMGFPKPVVRAVNDSLVVENVPVPRVDAATILRRRRLGAALEQLRVVTVARSIGRRLGTTPAAPVPDGHRQSAGEVERAVALILAELKALNEARGSRLVLVFLPRPGDESFPWADTWRAVIDREARRLGVPFIDLIPPVRARPIEEVKGMYVVPFAPSHYTADGNAWVATQILSRLRDLKLSPR